MYYVTHQLGKASFPYILIFKTYIHWTERSLRMIMNTLKCTLCSLKSVCTLMHFIFDINVWNNCDFNDFHA